MCKYINNARQRQSGGSITALGINVNGEWTSKEKQSEVEVRIVYMDKKIFLFTYRTPLMDVATIHKDLRTLAEIPSAEKVLLG